jgi:hypothetical protein
VPTQKGWPRMGEYVRNLGNESDLLALTFGISKDHRYFSKHSIEQRNRRLALNNIFRMGDNYAVRNNYIRMSVGRIGGSVDFDLVLSAVGSDGKIPRGHSSGNLNPRSSVPDLNKLSVLLDICDVVHGPKGIIPSFVWLEPFKERANLAGQVLFCPFDLGGPIVEVIREGKVAERVGFTPVSNGNGVGHLVETGAQIVDAIEHDAREFGIEAGRKLDLMNPVTGLRILFNHVGVRISWGGGLDGTLHISEVVVCASQNDLRAAE